MLLLNTTMMERPAPLPAGQAMDEVNQLEQQITLSGVDVDACLWRQAAIVAEQLKTMTQRAVAAQWINPRTGQPYDQKHVARVARIAQRFEDQGPQASRPPFREAYKAVKFQQQRHWSRLPPSAGGPIVEPPRAARASIEARREQCRAMAAEGATVSQIAHALGVHEATVNIYAKRDGYEICAKRMGPTRRHDSNRIVAQMTMDAENLTADVNLITFSDLHRHHLAEWICSFTHSAMQLQQFIRKLKELDT